MAAMKRTAKTAKTGKTKKSKKTRPKKGAKATARRRTVRYKCDSGCIAVPDELHVDYGDVVVMKAVGTDVKVKFDPKSPFRRKTFNIVAGGTDEAEVVKRSGSFEYTIKCAECATPALPPLIIID